MRQALCIGVAFLLWCICATAFDNELGGVFEGSPDDPAINYGGPATDVVSALNQKLLDGSVRLKDDQKTGYLRSVLDALLVPIESQIVAMAKTSVQQFIITPQNPRTLYFNDSVVVGYVQGGFIELAVQDPRRGIIFYTLGRRRSSSQWFSILDSVTFQREDQCLSCHISYDTMGVPGTLLRSVFPARDGTVLYQAGRFVTDHRSPMEERFGGWYLTGDAGPPHHLGNTFFSDPEKTAVPVKGEILDSLKSRLDPQLYLLPYSDVVALLVFDHQMHMMNLLTRVGWEARYAKLEKSGRTVSRLRTAAEEFVDYLLFVDEAPLDRKIRGSSGFAEKFADEGPQDRKGRSLRQFDLQRRLMRYPCSYMIYSEAFDTLPSELKDSIYRRMWAILSGEEVGPRYARLSRADRTAVIEILLETKKGLPEYFRRAVQ